MSEIYTYQTLVRRVDSRYSEKGSKFLASVFPASNMQEVENALTVIKADHPKARHVCFAYRLVEHGQLLEFSADAGEPGGSAGVPILNSLRSHELHGVIAIVVRYFGGTKLGIPGLINAYRGSTDIALSDASIRKIQRIQYMRLHMPMQLQPIMLDAAKRLGIVPDEHVYTDDFSVRLAFPLPDEEAKLKELLQLISKRDDPDLERLLKHLSIQCERLGAT